MPSASATMSTCWRPPRMPWPGRAAAGTAGAGRRRSTAGSRGGAAVEPGQRRPGAAIGRRAAGCRAQSDVELLDPQLLEIFTNEAETHLEALVGLADCARELPQPVTDALQRALHTLKGSAHMAGILPIAEIATPLENWSRNTSPTCSPSTCAKRSCCTTPSNCSASAWSRSARNGH